MRWRVYFLARINTLIGTLTLILCMVFLLMVWKVISRMKISCFRQFRCKPLPQMELKYVVT